MKICSKCKKEKDDNEYYTYWHSTQKKYRTRNICNTCMYEQKKRYKLKIKEEKQKLIEVSIPTEIVQPDPPESILNDIEERYCPNCGEYKLVTEFYKNKQTNKIFKNCKLCHNEASKKASNVYWEEKRNTIGSERLSPQPNTYLDETQKRQTFWLMELLGWTYNDNGVWSKEGIKDKDNNWVNINKDEPKQKIKRKSPIRRRQIDVDKIIELRMKGWKITHIADALGYSKPTVRTKLKQFYPNEED
jgi:hypothetical protein